MVANFPPPNGSFSSVEFVDILDVNVFSGSCIWMDTTLAIDVYSWYLSFYNSVYYFKMLSCFEFCVFTSLLPMRPWA